MVLVENNTLASPRDMLPSQKDLRTGIAPEKTYSAFGTNAENAWSTNFETLEFDSNFTEQLPNDIPRFTTSIDAKIRS